MDLTPLAVNIAIALIEMLHLVRGTTVSPPPFSPDRARQTFTIRTRDIGELAFLPTLHRELQRLAENTSWHTVFEPVQETVGGISSCRIDVALGYLPALEQDIHRKVPFTQRYVCVMRKGYPLDGQSIDKKTFLEHDHRLVENSGSGHRILERALIEAGARDRIKIRVRQYLAAPHCLLGSDLLWTVPEMLATTLSRYYPLTFTLEPPQIEPFEIALYWRDRYHKESSNMWFRCLIKELFLNTTNEAILDGRVADHEVAQLDGEHSDCPLLV